MAKISETELRIRLRKLESYHYTTGALVKRVGDQYEYTDDYIYTAYASALANLSAGKITSQQDATNFQFSPYNTAGILLAYRGFFINRSIYQSGDPTDYTWESTSGQSGYTSSERYYTTSTGLVENLGNPIKPGSGITWTVITAGTAVPGTAVWIAERFTIGGVPSIWSIYPVSAYIGSGQIVDSAVIADKIATNAVTTAKILDDAIDADKIAANAVTTAAILNDAIDATKIADNAVVTASIAANAIVANKILAGEIGTSHLAADSVTAAKVATNAIVADNIQAGAIGASEIAADAVTADKIGANVITASEIAGGTITASEIAADAITANAIATNAVTADAITAGTITANEIASNAITSAKVNADAITVDKIDLNGQLNVDSDEGSIAWGKTGGDDIVNSGLFIGNSDEDEPRFVIGSTNSFIYFNGTQVSAVGVAESATTGTETNYYTSGTTNFTISPLLGTIQIEIAGAGGGGGGSGGQYGSTGHVGGTSYIYVKRSNDTTRDTFSAAGGAGGTQGGCGNVATGGNGTGFGNQGKIGSAADEDQSHGGGAGSTHVQEPASRPTAGGGGVASGGGGNGGGWSQGAGCGGGAGSYYSTTYTIADTTDYLQIVIGAGGAGADEYVNSPGDNGGGGAGGAGMIRIKGVLA